MILITAQGRLAHEPELKLLPNGGSVCEFRLLSSRFAKGAELTEAVTFVCFGEDAERFCEGTEKGQLISATGSQETNTYKDANGQSRTFVKYRMTWFQKGPRANRGERTTDSQGARPNQGYTPSADRYERRSDSHGATPTQARPVATPPPPSSPDGFDDVTLV